MDIKTNICQKHGYIWWSDWNSKEKGSLLLNNPIYAAFSWAK